MAKRDGILRGLVHHLVREGDVIDTGECRFCPHHASLITLEINAYYLTKYCQRQPGSLAKGLLMYLKKARRVLGMFLSHDSFEP
jgi:hypothetical protein